MGKGENVGNQHFLLFPPSFVQAQIKPFPHNDTFRRPWETRLIFLPNSKILDWSKLKAFAGDKINVAEMMISLTDRVENIMEKGENGGYQRFLILPQCFQKPSFLGSFKVGIVW